jgi:hypothetical protein
MFFVELKPALNNKDIFNVEYIQQCKIKLELLKHKRDIAKCVNCPRYGYTKNYCHLKPGCIKCAGDRPLDKLISPKRKIKCCLMCPLWWKSSCELQGMYGLQGPTKENTPTAPVETILDSTNQTYPIH